MKKILFLVPVLVILLFSQKAQAQDSTAFDSEQFFRQVSETLLNTPSKRYQEESEILLERFYARWNIGRFNRMEKAEVQKVYEMMRAKKLKTYPYLYDYIYALTLLSESKQLPKSIIAWHVYMQKLLEEVNTKNLADFLDFTRELFEDERVFDKKTLSWYHRNARFTFELDSSFLVKYNQLTLLAATKKDSSLILKTKGVLIYDEGIWKGEGGTIKWSRFGEETADRIFVELDKYEIDLDQSSYSIDSVTMFYDRFFEHPIVGRFSDKIMSGAPNKRTSYPRFEAYLDDFEIDKLYPGVDYFGGFSLEGRTIFGIGGPFKPAQLTFWQADKKVGQATAEMIKLSEENYQGMN